MMHLLLLFCAFLTFVETAQAQSVQASQKDKAPESTISPFSLQSRDKSIFVGAIAGAYQLGVPENSAKFRATGRGGLFMTVLGIDHALHLATPNVYNGSLATGRAIVTTFAGTGPGIIEGNLDSYNTPSVPTADYNYTAGRDHWRLWVANTGWTPSIFLLNQNTRGSTSNTQMTSADAQDVVNATSDIRRLSPSIKLVLSYISPNTGYYPDWATDRYWSIGRDLAIKQGGLAIDVPVGYFLICPPAYRQVVKDEIKWAEQNRLVVIVLLSPFSTNHADCRKYPISRGICQFSPDPHMMISAQNVVGQLRQAGADPTIWIVDNYSEQAISPFPGTDDREAKAYNPNTILAIANWIAKNARTSPYPSSAVGLQSPKHIR